MSVCRCHCCMRFLDLHSLCSTRLKKEQKRQTRMHKRPKAEIKENIYTCVSFLPLFFFFSSHRWSTRTANSITIHSVRGRVSNCPFFFFLISAVYTLASALISKRERLITEHSSLCFCFAVCQLVCWLLCCSQCTAKWTVHRLWQPIPTTRASPRVSPLPPKEIPAKILRVWEKYIIYMYIKFIYEKVDVINDRDKA